MVGSLDDDQRTTTPGLWDKYLAENVQIVHPLLLLSTQEASSKKKKIDSASSQENNNPKRPPTLEESLGLLHTQNSRGVFGPLEVGLLDENQVLRHGFSNMAGFRGSIVQIFTLQEDRIVSIHVAKTMAPWKKRWWWFRRKSGRTKRLLWQTWWEEWEEEVVQDQAMAEEDLAFQQRLIETNFFVF